ncbi:hypothetical protein [Brevibacillus sp. NRS-1366]|uniref:hypothetical protein n=1 Tax=Brevibacillus sp. NRS-1366 TaxID=3233899 RepID=UPI003D22B007
MTVSGEKRNKVTVKMNGKFWDQKREGATEQRTPKELPSRVRIQPPPVPFMGPTPVQKGNEALDRMMQLRSMTTDREPSREAEESLDPIELHEETQEESLFSKRKASRLLLAFPKGPLLHTVLTTGGAIAIGLLFGFLVLTVFSKEDFSESYRSVLTDTVQTLTAQGSDTDVQAIIGPVLPDAASTNKGNAPTAAGGPQSDVPLQLPEVKMFVAQAGVFQREAAPDSVVGPLDKLGIPHLLYKDSAKQYMFAAAAPTRDAVLGFAASLKNKGMDVYVKEFSFPAFQGTIPVAKAQGATASPDLGAFFANGVGLTQTLSAHSGLIITTGQLNSSPEETSALKEQHRQFLEESRLVKVPDEWKTHFTGMVNGINQAIAAREKMAEANAGKKAESAESYAWQVQAGVLGYLESYLGLLQQIENNK